MDVILSRQLLVVLAFSAAIIYGYRGQWENMLTRLLIGIVFLSVMYGFKIENQTMNILIRWLFITLLFVEILSWMLRTVFDREK